MNRKPAQTTPHLVHVCCAPDAAAALDENRGGRHQALYFYNPNIHPKAEYDKRLEAVRQLAEAKGVEVHEGPYDAERFFELTKGHETDLEKGERCRICFEMRMEQTARFAGQQGFDSFSSVLTTSPKKVTQMIFDAGEGAQAQTGVAFESIDYKKQDGFRRSREITEELGLYVQDYCGCSSSRIQREIEAKLRERMRAPVERDPSASPLPELRLLALVSNPEGAILLEPGNPWTMPQTEAQHGHSGRERLKDLLKRRFGVRVQSDGSEPRVFEERRKRSDGGYDHTLALLYRFAYTADVPLGDSAPEREGRWMCPEDLHTLKLDPLSAWFLRR